MLKSNQAYSINDVINSYEKALNGNNIESMIRLFTDDGTLVLQGAATIIGTESVKLFYSSLFKSLKFDLKFNIDEVVQMSPEWAFVRTTTAGTVNVISNNSGNSSDGHEIFILKKQADENWKISRYAGSSAK